MFIQPASQLERVLAPQGLHTAILYQIIDMGSHRNEQFDVTQRKVRLAWELSEELMDDGRPISVSREYTMSSSEKSALHQLIKGWTGEDISESGFDLRELLGEPGNINISHETSQKKTIYAKVVGVTPLKKNEIRPTPHNNLIIFDMTDGELDTVLYNSLPNFMKEKIMASPEYQQAVARANGIGPANKRDDALLDDDAWAALQGK